LESIDELNVLTPVYGGLQDEDDALEELAAVASPMKALASLGKNKVNVMSTVSHFIQHRNCALQANIIIEPGLSTRSNLGSPDSEGDLVTKAFQRVRSTAENRL
jgi:hypothetical protein